MRDIELLAPAGSMDSLIAGVENGADAVYLGGRVFNARQYAGNFDDEEMQRAVEYCHVKGAKVFVTLNILIKDHELSQIPEYVTGLYNIGVDALIIQDIGVGKLIKEILPDFELHASTQMTAHNLDSVNFLYNIGYKRVVLSRELSIKEIEYITTNTKADIEVFSHGALCICYSGQCLMSSMIGGRSGNRGRCAQPCRQKYVLNTDGKQNFEGYVLSPKDLSTIENLHSIINTGVKSLKIEGRMKRPEYVAAVISAYRRTIDRYLDRGEKVIPEEDKKDLLKVFNRGGFTTAHLFGKGRSEMMSYDRPKNWGIYIGSIKNVNKRKGKVEVLLEDDLSLGDGVEIWTEKGANTGYTVSALSVNGKLSDKGYKGQSVLLDYKGGEKGDKVYKTLDIELDKRLESTYKSNDPLRKVPVNCSMLVMEGKPAEIHLYDTDGNYISLQGPVPEAALKVPLSEQRVREQLEKMGGTPFSADHIEIMLDGNITLPISAINSMRRDAALMLAKLRSDRYKPQQVSAVEVNKKTDEFLSKSGFSQRGSIKLSAGLKDSHLVSSAIKGGADIIIFGGDKLRGFDLDYKDAIGRCKAEGVKIYISSPRIIKNEFSRIKRELQEAIEYGADGIYVQNLGILKYVMDNKIPFASGFGLNIFNYASSNMMAGMGSSFLSLSPEMSLKDMKHAAPYIENCEALCYGRMEMMVSEYCPVGRESQCGGDDKCKLPCSSQIHSLTDRVGMSFPVRTDIYCRSHIYNSKILSMMENVKDMVDSGINILRTDFLDEEEEEVFSIIYALKEIIKSTETGEKQLPLKVRSIIQRIKESGYTKGHYYRGVE